MKRTQCILCGSNSLKKHKQYYASDKLRVCQKCGMCFSESIPSEEELKAYYKVYAYDNETYSPITKQRYLSLLEEFEAYRKINKILDIGCGSGAFLEVARSKGWEVYGTEYSEKALELLESKNITTQKGNINLDNYPSDSFDIITSFEVLEHMAYPTQETFAVNALLRHGGLHYITCPNFKSISKKLTKGKWSVINYPEHLNYFTPKTLHQFLLKQGFRKEKLFTSGLSLKRLKESKNRKAKQSLSSNLDEDFRRKIERRVFYRLIYKTANFLLRISGKGDTLKAYYIKED